MPKKEELRGKKKNLGTMTPEGYWLVIGGGGVVSMGGLRVMSDF